MPTEAAFTIAELARLTGVNVRTIRYYLAQGLIPASGESGPGAHYGQGHLDRLRLIKRLQAEYLPNGEIRRRLAPLSDAEVAELLAAEGPAPDPARPTTSALDYVRGLLRAQGSGFTTAAEGGVRVAASAEAGAPAGSAAAAGAPAPSAAAAGAPGARPILARSMPIGAYGDEGSAGAASGDLRLPTPGEPGSPAPGGPGAPAPGRPGAPTPTEAMPVVGRIEQLREAHAPTEPETPLPERSQWERLSLGPNVELHVRRPLSRIEQKRVERLITIARQVLEEGKP